MIRKANYERNNENYAFLFCEQFKACFIRLDKDKKNTYLLPQRHFEHKGTLIMHLDRH